MDNENFRGENSGVKLNNKLSTDLGQNLNIIKRVFACDDSVIYREFESLWSDKLTCCAIYIEAMIKKNILEEHIMKPIMHFSTKGIEYEDVLSLLEKKVIYSCEASRTGDMTQVIDAVLIGKTVILINGQREALIVYVYSFVP